MRKQLLLIATAAFAAALLPRGGEAAAGAAFEPEAIVRRTDRVAVLALARAGERLVAAGERGRILVSDDHGTSWKVATTPTHHTLTALAFSDAKTGFATGHQGVLLRTEDGGLTWKQTAIDMKDKPALFAVRVCGDHGIAVGAYGTYLESVDAGRTWTARKIGPADFDRHLTGIAAPGQDRIVLAGEAGTLLTSTDAGKTWQVLKSPYEGSFFGAIGLRNGNVIAYGMRGNAYRSADAGRTWQRVELGTYKGALQGATEFADGTVVLTGADGMIATSADGGATFAPNPIASRALVASLVKTAQGRWLAAGPGGLRWAD